MSRYMIARKAQVLQKKIDMEKSNLQKDNQSLSIKKELGDLEEPEKDLDYKKLEKLAEEILIKFDFNTSGNPITVITRIMEIVEKIKGLTGEEKKQVVIFVIKKLNRIYKFVYPENLDVIIDTVCYVSKLSPKINTKYIKNKLKKIFSCKCFNPSIKE